MKILIVDDDKIIRMGLSKLLMRLFDKHEVIRDFQNGLLALEYLKENEANVDLVIADIKMPIMTGIELMENSIKDLKNPPIFIILSGYDEFEFVRDTMKAGAFDYLLKPVKQNDLIRVIEEVELRINNDKKNNKILDKSIEVLRKDAFKQILFSNSDTSNKILKSLMETINLDTDYIFEMIVIDNYKMNIFNKNKLFNDYIKEILDCYENMRYLTFNYEDSIYLIFYFNESSYQDKDKFMEKVIKCSDSFIENNMNVFIFDYTNQILELRKYSKLIIKAKQNMIYEGKVNKYFLNKMDKLIDIENNMETSSKAIAIKLAKKYIIKNFNKNITLKDVAEEVYLSQNYLSELFKKELGEGFYEYLSNYRIKKAKELLLTTNLKIYEVAESIGYNDSITFGRAFKKITGTTPNKFRNDTN